MAKIASQSSNSRGASPKTSSSQKVSNNELQEIQKLAYQFYADRGYQNGHDREDWLRAEAIVKSRRS